uniref:(California timema) hypothetical protein n=1 Tax=Timema californicum TaxID=61474 RepID=A0A7R9P998_TIMCA|nr:unnamed protein product [Timema californicum]
MTKMNVAHQFIKAGGMNLEDFFHVHVSRHGPHCEHLHDLSNNKRGKSEEEASELLIIHSTTSDSQVFEDDVDQYLALGGQENSRSIQLSDSDLSPESVVRLLRNDRYMGIKDIVRRSRAEFCVTIGDLGGVFNPDYHRRRSKKKERKSTSSPSSKAQSMEMYRVEPEVSNSRESSTLNPIFKNLESQPELVEEGNQNRELQVTGLTKVLAGVKDVISESAKTVEMDLGDVQSLTGWTDTGGLRVFHLSRVVAGDIYFHSQKRPCNLHSFPVCRGMGLRPLRVGKYSPLLVLTSGGTHGLAHALLTTNGASDTASRTSSQEKNEADADVVDIILEPREERNQSLPNQYMPIKEN